MDYAALLESAANRAGLAAGDMNAFRRGDGSIYNGNGLNDGRVREAFEAIQREEAEKERKKQEEAVSKDVYSKRDSLIQQNEDSTRKNLAKTLVGIRSGANSRGLLYSGLRQGQEMGATGAAGAGMNQFRAGANAAAETQKSEIMAGRAGTGLDAFKNDATAANQAYQAALERKKQKSGLMGAIGTAVGTIGGAVIGGPAGAAVGGKLGSMAGGL